MRVFRLILGLLLAGLAVAWTIPTRAATILVVGSGGYATINAAVQAAGPGQAIAIHAGVYPEQVELDKAVALRPYGDGPVWVDGGCARQVGVHVTAAGATVTGLGVRLTAAQGVLVEGLATGGVTLDHLTVQDFDCAGADQAYAAGIAVWYGGPGQRVTNNTITRRVALPGGPRGMEDGIWFKSTSQAPSGGGHTIAGNTVVGGFDGIGGEAEGDPHGAFDGDTTIADNTISGCWDDGVQVDGNTANVAVTGNRITGCGDGVSLDPAWGGPLTIGGNTIAGVVGQLDYYGNLLCFKVGGGGTGAATLADNVCAMPPGSTGGGIGEENSGLSPLVTRGNVFQVDYYVFEFPDTPPAGSSFDGDCMHSTDPIGRFVKWGGTRYDSLAAFQAATGQELNGTQSTACAGTSPGPNPSPPPNPAPSPNPMPGVPPAPSPAPGWSNWSSLGGILSDSPAAAGLGSRVYVFAKGSDNALYTKSADATGSFTGWTRLGGVLTAAPAAANFDGRLYAFAKGTDSALYVKSSADGATWTDWSDLGGILTAPPAAATGNGRLYVFAKGSDNALYAKSSADGINWTNWQDLGGILTAAPAAAGYQGGVFAFAKGSNNALYVQSSADGRAWSGWSDLGGVLASAPAAAVSGNGTLYTFAGGTGNAVYERHTANGTTWTQWAGLGGAIDGPPAAASIPNGPLFVFARWADGTLWERFLR